MARSKHTSGVVVIGLGRFGRSLALELVKEGTEVLGIDSDRKIVQSLAGRLTHVVEADSTNEEAMRQLSVNEFDRAVIGVGNDIEASLLSASVVMNLGVPNVWAKAISHSHARILSQIGVHHVVRPEHDMGKRVAHLFSAPRRTSDLAASGHAFQVCSLDQTVTIACRQQLSTGSNCKLPKQGLARMRLSEQVAR